MTKEWLWEIKEFAKINALFTDEDVKVTAEHPNVAVSNPWMDASYRNELKNSEAVRTWGLTAVIDFCEKVTSLRETHPCFIEIVRKIYSLDDSTLSELKERLEEKNLTIERITFEYTALKRGLSEPVEDLLNKDEPLFSDCSWALASMYAARL